MKQKFTFLAIAAFMAGTMHLAAQTVAEGPDGLKHCGTDEQMRKVFAEHPELKADFDASQAQAEAQDQIDFLNGYHSTERNGNPGVQDFSAPSYIIPVVFHIIHDYGYEDISDAQVIDEVRILNRDYRKNNPDTNVIVPQFTSIAADTKIEFRLANLDPNGNCTNGIDRIASAQTYIGDDGSKLNYWPRNHYLNVWVVKNISSGAAGYAYLPNGAPTASVDGVLILSTYIGSIGTGSSSTSRALTHEIGHFLNLQHTWGNTNNPGVACGNDGVNDTPYTKGWTTCNLTSNDICNPGTVENVQNYMDYSYCSRMFTAGQKTRMTSALNSANGQRNQLSTASNWTFTGINNNPANVCAPHADFLPNAQVYCCAGSSVTFTDISWNGHPTSWNWSFPGGTPTTSTDSMPVIQYNTPGLYAVTLTAANGSGSNTLTRTGIVKVFSTTAQYSNWNYTEGFESATTFTNDWIIVNPQGNGWARVTTAAATGTASAKITNATTMAGTVDEMISPAIDLSAITSPVFTFKVAYRQRATGDLDKLHVYTSTDCGNTWSQRYVKSGTTLSTGAATTSAFTPSASEWRTETVNISAISSSTNVRFKFTFDSQGGNNIYVDDINIAGVNGIDAPDLGIQHFAVFPNPAQDNTLVSFSLDKSQDVTLQLFDMTGRVVSTIYSGNLAEGEQQFQLQQPAEILSKGIYFVRLTTAEGRMVTQKLIVE
jgi:PKD repeat protein